MQNRAVLLKLSHPDNPPSDDDGGGGGATLMQSWCACWQFLFWRGCTLGGDGGDGHDGGDGDGADGHDDGDGDGLPVYSHHLT